MEARKKLLSVLLTLVLLLGMVPLAGTAYASENGSAVCTVSFDSAGGSLVESQQVTAGEKAKEPESPSREGYAFSGWFTEKGEEFDFSAPVTEDLKLTAKWVEKLPDIVEAEADDPYTDEQADVVIPLEDVAAQPLDDEQSAEDPPAPAAEGEEEAPPENTDGTIVIEAAETEPAPVNPEETDDAMPAAVSRAPRASYDVWVEGVQVTSGNASDVLGDGNIRYDAGTSTLTVNGSYTYEEDSFIRAQTDLTITGTITIKGGAPYSAISVHDNALTLDSGANLTLSGSGSNTLEASTLTVNGATLTVTNSGNSAISINNLTLNGGSITARASCLGIRGIASSSSGSVTVNGGTLTAVNTWGNSTYRYAAIGVGSLTVNDGKVDATNQVGDPIRGTIEFGPGIDYALKEDHHWIIQEGPLTYTVSFDANGHGTAPAAQTVEYGQTATRPADPTASGWNFGGWYTEAECTNAFDFATPITGSITLFAKWTKSYELWVGGQQVTEDNKDDIPGVQGGSASYDPATNTLTFNGVTGFDGYYLEGAEPALVYSAGDLIVRGTLNASDEGLSSPSTSNGIYSEGALTIADGTSLDLNVFNDALTGKGGIVINGGTVTVRGRGGASIRATGGRGLTINGGTVTTTGLFSIDLQSGKITVNGGTVTAVGQIRLIFGTLKVNDGILDVTNADGNAVDHPESVSYASTHAVVEGTLDGSHFRIAPASAAYDVWVQGVQVTEDNKDDVLGDGGSVVFDPDSATLTLTDADITGAAIPGLTPTAGIYSKIDLTLALVGSNTVTDIDNTAGSKAIDGMNLTITGSGSLTATGSANSNWESHGIFARRTLTINSGTVNAAGGAGKTTSYGLYGRAGITINGGSVTAKGGTSEQAGGSIGLLTQSASAPIVINGGVVTAIGQDLAINGDPDLSGYPAPAVTVNNEPSATGADAWNGTDALGGSGSTFKYVKIEPAPTTHTVTFDANGHGTAPAAQTVEDGKTATEPAAPTETGWSFGGWYTEAECTNAFDFAAPITGDITLYAKWTVVTHTVTFNANGHGTAPAAQTVEYGKTATKPADPTASGWSFGGWYTEAECNNAFDFAAPITGDVTLFAKWTKLPAPVIRYTITYDLNGGTLDGKTGIVTVSVEKGATIILPRPTRGGYVFAYWEGSRYEAGESYTVTGNHTFTAQWRACGSGKTNSPKTGDNSFPGLWLGLSFVSAGGLIGLGMYSRKRRKKAE